MILKVMLFATLKDLIGAKEIEIQLNKNCCVSDLISKICQLYPQVEPYTKNIVVSVNQKFAGLHQSLNENDEVAIFPPVSGG